MRSLSIVRNHGGLVAPNDEALKVPDNGDFFRVLFAWQQAKNDYKPIQYQPDFEQPNRPTPSPLKLWGCEQRPTSGYQEIHESWQRRYFELYRLMVGPIPEDGKVIYWYTGGEGRQPFTKVPAGTLHANPRFEPGTLLDAYSHIWEDHRASTDGAAYNTTNGWYRDVVMGCHLENPHTWRTKCLTWRGSLVKKHPAPPGPVKSDELAIMAWDHSIQAPPLSVLLAPDAPPLWWGTEASVEPLRDASGKLVLQNGRPTYKVAHYPWLKLVRRRYGLMPEVGTPYFPIGKGGWNTIKKDDVARVENGQLHNPYWP